MRARTKTVEGLASGLLLIFVVSLPAAGKTKVEKVSCLGQPNCYRLSNEAVEVVVTTDIGPRVIRYALPGEENILAEMPAAEGVKTALGIWKPWGGHRLWTAPEAMPRSYAPDNGPVQFQLVGTNSIRLTQPVEPQTGIQKEMTVTLDETGPGVTIRHRIINRNLWAVELAPWALTIMNGGGTTILPQEPYISHDDALLPARPLVLWHYTDLSDPRWTFGKKYIRLKTDAALAEPQKVGIANKQGWAAYLRQKTLFIKKFSYKEGAVYPDYGSNTETYTAGSFMEVETLGPLERLEPGAAAEHDERWHLFRQVETGATEADLERALTPLLKEMK